MPHPQLAHPYLWKKDYITNSISTHHHTTIHWYTTLHFHTCKQKPSLVLPMYLTCQHRQIYSYTGGCTNKGVAEILPKTSAIIQIRQSTKILCLVAHEIHATTIPINSKNLIPCQEYILLTNKRRYAWINDLFAVFTWSLLRTSILTSWCCATSKNQAPFSYN